MERRELTPPRRQYYSVRSGRRPANQGFTLAEFKRFFLPVYDKLEMDGLFQEWFGYFCVDVDHVHGRAGGDVALYVFRKLRRTNLWPVSAALDTYTEDDLFDMIEFLHDHASKGVTGKYHQFSDCGWHYDTFDQAAGRAEFRAAVNELLMDYGQGFELSAGGEILTLPNDAFAPLLAAELPHTDAKNVNQRVKAAMQKYRRRAMSERRDAIRDLADVLEYLRDEARAVLKSKDEADLFNLANNFGIRHHNKEQKTDYDEAIWLSWMFYYYLATIHACVRLIEKAKKK